MEIVLNELLNSKRYVTEGGITFRSPNEYLGKFIDSIPEANFTVEVSDSVVNAEQGEEDQKNTAYGKVLLKANFPDINIPLRGNKSEAIIPNVGVVYSLIGQKPTMKVFAGFDVRVCMNMTVFNPEYLHQIVLTDSPNIIYDKASEFRDGLEGMISEYRNFIQKLDNKVFESPADLDKFTGGLLKESIKNVKLGSSNVNAMAKALYKGDSRYYIGRDFSNNSYWNAFNALTEFISKGDLLEKPSKVLNFSQFFN